MKAGVPDTFSMVDYFKDKIKDSPEKLAIANRITSNLSTWLKKLDQSERVDVELLMEILDRLENKDKDILLQFFEVKENDLKPIVANALKNELKDCIHSAASVKQDTIQYFKPLLAFMAANRPLDVFTVNYDITVEQFCNLYQKEYTDGFDVYWNNKNLDRTDVDIRLFKLHGSIDWFRTDKENYVKVLVKNEKMEIDLMFGEKARALILYPMRKWDYVEPLLELMMRLKESLEYASFVFVIGYSFRDEHLTRIVWDSARKNRNLTLVLIDPDAYRIYEEKLRYYPSVTNNVDRVPSPLEGRVLPLAYKFEDIFPALRNRYFENLHRAMQIENELRLHEDLGIKTDWSEAFRHFAECEFLEKVNSIKEKSLFSELRSFVSWEQIIPISYKLFLAAFNANDKSAENWFHSLGSYATFIEPSNFTVQADRLKQTLRINLTYPQHGNDSVNQLFKILNDMAVFGKLRHNNMFEEKAEKVANIVNTINDLATYFSWWVEDRMTFDFFARNQETKYHDLIEGILPKIENVRKNDDKGDIKRIEEDTTKILQQDLSDIMTGKGLGTMIFEERKKLFNHKDSSDLS